MEIMNFTNFLKFKISESLKDLKLNVILDKLSKKIPISNHEKDFLDNFDSIEDDDLKDHKMISKETVSKIILDLIEKKKKIICNLKDRDGKIGLNIVDITNEWGGDCTLILSNGSKCVVHDRFFYNIIYSNGSYLLEQGDEFFEKIPVNDKD